MEQVEQRRDFARQHLLIPCLIMLLVWGMALYQWQAGSDSAVVIFLLYIGVFIGIGIGSYIALPPLKRPIGRRIILFMMGLLLLVAALISDHGNMQIEGLFFGVFSGIAPYIVLHYLLAKIAGPLVFGRVWCGWACWFAMIFDLLPYPYSRYRQPGAWDKVRYWHFGMSLLMVAALWFGFGYAATTGIAGLQWFIMGLLLYYAVGIVLAFALKDNRAFCKYLCPIAVVQKASSRFALLKIAGEAPKCDSCNACVEMCPMNIRVPDYILHGERVLSTECTLCQTCINVCPHDALKLSFGFDVGGKELIDYVPPKTRPSER